MNPQLIGLAGYARVGKDTVGQILVDAHGYERRAFADKLRELAWQVDPVWGELVAERGYEDVKSDPLYAHALRTFLVNLGAGARKVLGGGVWLDACLPGGTGNWEQRRWNGRDWIEPCPPTVVTDVRYLNEALRIRDLGGEVWYISRPGVEAANEEEALSISFVVNECPVRWFVNDHDLVNLPYVVSRFLAHDV